MTSLVLLILGLVVALAVWWRFFRIARPQMPPIALEPDDPLILEATRKATRSIDRLRELMQRPHRSAHAKVRFVSSSDEVEFLWSEIRELRDAEIEVLYTTPPVTHTGRLERVHSHPLSDLVDWQVETTEGLYEGGFSMHAMFIRAREQWGALLPGVAELERRYVTGSAD